MYYHHQNGSYNQHDDAYRRRHRRQNPSYYDQNYSPRNPSSYGQNYPYRRRSPSYYDQNYAFRHRRHHQHHHHHQNSSYDQIPHHHHQKHRFYDHNLSYNDHRRQIEACPTSARPVKKPKEAPVVAFPVDVLILILARLPAKSLLKFRCVCKSWNSLIQQDHHFLSLHQLHLNHDANKSSSPPLVTFHREGSYVILNYSSASSPYEIEFSRSEVVRPRFITNSCNGLLGLYNSCTFFIVNPTIRKLRPLPMMPTPCFRSSKAGLGFDASTGVYKVVRIFDRRCEEGMIKPYRLACEVYYLGGSGGWKLIDGDPLVLPSRTSLPVVVDGAILWASETLWEKDREVVALSFDLREEKFSVIMHPEGGSSRRVLSESHVFASGGCICVAEESASVHMNIWLLMKDDKKNNSDKWVKQYVIDFTNLLTQISPPFFGEPQPLTTDHIGRIVISWERGRKFYYYPRTGSFDKHELDATHADVHHAAPYTKSMVWPWPTRCGVQ
ncbi:F-box protein-like [Iris pallida]|uniref:F-box protein-like n=1 Tax=Iris pallida TaxID=29817 RepID=A0AAX6DPN2_IRIPA|nr:F-box protein-like [Iris pallida]